MFKKHSFFDIIILVNNMRRIIDLDINNKIVIIRFDYNVPIKDNKIVDDTRIIKSLKTLNYVIERAKKVIILSHLGRIKTEEDKKNNSLKIVCDYLSNLINKKVAFCKYEDDINSIINNNEIIMFENTRFFDLDNNKESNCNEELSKYFASFGDVFINDAFGVSHRSAASNVGISKYLDSANGFLVEEEVNNLNKLLDNPNKPFIVIMGGKKVSDKIKVIDNLLKKCDKLLIGGAMTYTFLKSKGVNIGSSLCEEEYLDYAKTVLDNYGNKVLLAVDNYVLEDNKIVNKTFDEMNNSDIGKDIGEKSIDLFKNEIQKAKTVFFNGPVGLFEEEFYKGTKEICETLNSIDAYIVVGGGDTLNAVNKYTPNNNFILSTGGGASLEYLEGNGLPGIIEG